MMRASVRGLVAGALMAVSMQASANGPDYVVGVYVCGTNYLQIFLKSGTVLQADLTDTANMSQSLFDKIFSISLSLMTTGKQLAYYNDIKTETTCSRSVIEINAMSASSSS